MEEAISKIVYYLNTMTEEEYEKYIENLVDNMSKKDLGEMIEDWTEEKITNNRMTNIILIKEAFQNMVEVNTIDFFLKMTKNKDL